MKAGPQNRRFASATCSKVSSATVWVKYPQQTIIIDLLSWKMCHSSAICVFPISCAVAWFHRVIFSFFVLVKGGEFHLDFWILLVPKMVISKLSGNTVWSTHLRLQKAFWYVWLFTENWIQLTQNLTLELNYLQFDAKIVWIGEIKGLELHKEVYYGLLKFVKIQQDVLGWPEVGVPNRRLSRDRK